MSSDGAVQSVNRRGDARSPSSGARSLSLSPLEPMHFGHYVVVGRLGHGGMAEVLLGLALGPGPFRKLIALKRLHAHLEADPDIVQMFEYEASVAALLCHPHIPQVYETGCLEGRHFIAMEYVEGEPLHRVLARLREEGPIDPRLAARVALDALEGLEHAHATRDYEGRPLGIVHRDVSPHNLLVGTDGHVRVLDFGIAKAETRAAYTQPGFIRGKLAYVAPEMVTGEFDLTADLWSVGVILWEALAGRRLFAGADDAALLRAVLTAPVPALAELVPDVPAPLAEIVRRALSRDPAQRPSSAAEMARALRDWLGYEGEERALLARAMELHFGAELAARRASVRAASEGVERTRTVQRRADAAAALAGALGSVAPAQVAATQPPAAKPRRMGSLVPLALLGIAAAGALAWLTRSADASPRPEVAAAAAATSESPEPAPPNVPPPRVEPAASAPQALPAPQALRFEPEPQSSAAPSSHSGWRRRSARSAPPAPEPTPASDSVVPVPAAAVGRLELSATPYAIVSLGDRRLGVTPIDVELPAGVHVLTLRSPERAIETTYRVRIAAGERVARRLELE